MAGEVYQLAGSVVAASIGLDAQGQGSTGDKCAAAWCSAWRSGGSKRCPSLLAAANAAAVVRLPLLYSMCRALNIMMACWKLIGLRCCVYVQKQIKRSGSSFLNERLVV